MVVAEGMRHSKQHDKGLGVPYTVDQHADGRHMQQPCSSRNSTVMQMKTKPDMRPGADREQHADLAALSPQGRACIPGVPPRQPHTHSAIQLIIDALVHTYKHPHCHHQLAMAPVLIPVQHCISTGSIWGRRSVSFSVDAAPPENGSLAEPCTMVWQRTQLCSRSLGRLTVMKQCCADNCQTGKHRDSVLLGQVLDGKQEQ